MFETEDLVCRKNEKHVILTILEVARRGAKIGMLAPMLVQFEQEIDREIARWVRLALFSNRQTWRVKGWQELRYKNVSNLGQGGVNILMDCNKPLKG